MNALRHTDGYRPGPLVSKLYYYWVINVLPHKKGSTEAAG